jgi:hypothetical protein
MAQGAFGSGLRLQERLLSVTASLLQGERTIVDCRGSQAGYGVGVVVKAMYAGDLSVPRMCPGGV